MNMILKRNRRLSFKTIAVFSLTIWCIFAIYAFYYPQSKNFYNYIAYITSVFYILTLLFIGKVCSQTSQKDRFTFLIFGIGILVSLIKDSIANYILPNLAWLHIPKEFGYSFVYIGYIKSYFWNIIVLVFLITLLKKYFMNKIVYKPSFLIFIIFYLILFSVLLYFSQPQKLQHINWMNIAYFGIWFIDSINFILIIYALIHSKNINLSWLLSSLVVMVSIEFSAVFYYNYNYNQNFDALSDLFWLLWIILAFLAFYRIYHKKNYQINSWFVAPNTLESKLAFSTFALTNLGLIIFFILAYMFDFINTQKFICGFLLIMTYSLISILIAKRIAGSFTKPFQQLQCNIQELMSLQKIPTKSFHFEISEFDFLQKFIVNHFTEYNNKSEQIKTMAKMAVQVAHDIRSPAAAIMMLVKEETNLPEQQRISLREAATRVQDIANNLLNNYQQKQVYSQSHLLMLVPTILSVISEKRAQYHNKKINISTLINKAAYFKYINVNATDFKRIISNLIDNSAEAVCEKQSGTIDIKIKANDQKVKIIITDNGLGIDDFHLKQLNEGKKINSSKKSGFGLGLEYVKQFVIYHQGNIEFESTLGEGTTITLLFNTEKSPCWLAEEISLCPDQKIVILDDDYSIHGAWDQRLFKIKSQYHFLEIHHFYSGEDCLNYLSTLSINDHKKVLLLCDYELINQPFSGLDIIERSKTNKSVLVTSYYENEKIIKRSILANTKILPKSLAAEIPLNIQIETQLSVQQPDIILIDDQKELSLIIQFLAKSKNITMDVFNDPYSLWEKLAYYPFNIIICFDYDLNLPINGIELAYQLYSLGYHNLYLATGYDIKQSDVPYFIKVLSDKMMLLKLSNTKST